jgi:hypothetical protein
MQQDEAPVSTAVCAARAAVSRISPRQGRTPEDSSALQRTTS